MKKGFTLIEMLVVIGIIAVLSGAAMASYSHVVSKAQTAKAQELVSNVATALTQLLQNDGSWPSKLLSAGGSGGGEIDEQVGYILARRGVLSLLTDNSENIAQSSKLSGMDKFGVVDNWAADVIKRKIKGGGNLSTDTPVPTGGTIQDHRLRFAVDSDYEGQVRVNRDGVNATIRASAVVWAAGKDGKFGTRDDLKSWTKGQEVK